MRSVTQSDIARKVGVSQAAVSMALNGADSPLLAARTVKRIVLTAQRMGYAPNRFAQALRTRRTWTLACLVPDFANPFYPALLKGAQQVAEKPATMCWRSTPAEPAGASGTWSRGRAKSGLTA